MPRLWLEDIIPLHVADVTFPATHPLAGETGAILAFAVRHPGGVILFETGIGQGNKLVDRYYQPVQRPLEDELARHELGLGDVVGIANSHLHFDHCGNNRLFPGVPTYVQMAEYRAAHQPNYTVADWVDFDDAEYRQIEGDVAIAAGIKVVSTPGHTAGHQSLTVETTEGPVVLAGQAIYSCSEYRHVAATDDLPEGDEPPDRDSYLASARRLLEVQPRRAFFSHDTAVWEPDDG